MIIPKPSSLGLLGKLWYRVLSFLIESAKKTSVAASPGDARVAGDEQSRDIPTLLAFLISCSDPGPHAAAWRTAARLRPGIPRPYPPM